MDGPAHVLPRTRLSAMMFLFYFGVGAWIVTLPTYLLSPPTRGGLYFTTAETGWVMSTTALSGMLAQVFVGLLADRLFRAERVFAVACLVSAALLAVAGWWCEVRFVDVDAAYRAAAAGELVDGRPVLELADVSPLPPEVKQALERVEKNPAVRRASCDAFGPLFAVMLVQSFAMQLGVTLSTVLALRNLSDPAGMFARVRLWGTVGWVVAGNVIAAFLVGVSAQPVYLAAAAAGLCGVYSFTLPATRPKGTGKTLAESFGVPALGLLRDRAFVVFLAVAGGASVVNQFYVVYAHRYFTDLGIPAPERVMTLGQVVEVVCMFAMPLLNPRRWMKVLMLLGLGGWVLRMAAMASLSEGAAVGLAIPMHGWSYAFFSIVAATFIDREAPPMLRASAQGLVSFVTAGVGPLAGNLLAAAVVDDHRAGTTIDWQPVWVVPLVASAVLFAVFAAFFRPPPEKG